MRERIIYKNTPDEEVPPVDTSTQDAEIEKLKRQINADNIGVERSGVKVRRDNAEDLILVAENRIRELENQKRTATDDAAKILRKLEIKSRLKDLEGISNKSHGSEHDAVDAEATALEDEMRALERAGQPEKTPAEWREQLREVIADQAAAEPAPTEVPAEALPAIEPAPTEIPPERLPPTAPEAIPAPVPPAVEAAETSEVRAERSTVAERSAYFRGRADALDTRLDHLGGIEKGFRWLGEQYDKMGWKSKLGVGVALGLGAGIASAVSLPVAFGFLGGIAAQRIAGMSSMFMKFERNAQDNSSEWAKEKAMGKAMLWTAAMTGAVMLAVEGVKQLTESEIGTATKEWLKNMWPFGQPVQAPTATAEAPATIVELPGPEIPPVYANATPGNGYEYMMKRMWEQLQEHPLDLNTQHQLDPNSDILKLVNADAASIDKIVHQIASDPNHGFFNPDGTSVLIKPTDMLAFNTEGQVIHLSQEGVASVHAPESAPVTPAYHPEAHTASLAEAVKYPDFPEDSDVNAVPVEVESPVVDEVAQAIPEPLPQGTVESPPVTRVEATYGDATILGQPEATPVTEIIRNQFGLEIPAGQSHIYAGEGDKLFVFGSTPENQTKAIGDFFASPENVKSVIYGTDSESKYRIPYFLGPDGKPTAGLPEQTGWIWKSWAKPPSPDEFQKMIKQ